MNNFFQALTHSLELLSGTISRDNFAQALGAFNAISVGDAVDTQLAENNPLEIDPALTAQLRAIYPTAFTNNLDLLNDHEVRAYCALESIEAMQYRLLNQHDQFASLTQHDLVNQSQYLREVLDNMPDQSQRAKVELVTDIITKRNRKPEMTGEQALKYVVMQKLCNNISRELGNVSESKQDALTMQEIISRVQPTSGNRFNCLYHSTALSMFALIAESGFGEALINRTLGTFTEHFNLRHNKKLNPVDIVNIVRYLSGADGTLDPIVVQALIAPTMRWAVHEHIMDPALKSQHSSTNGSETDRIVSLLSFMYKTPVKVVRFQVGAVAATPQIYLPYVSTTGDIPKNKLTAEHFTPSTSCITIQCDFNGNHYSARCEDGIYNANASGTPEAHTFKRKYSGFSGNPMQDPMIDATVRALKSHQRALKISLFHNNNTAVNFNAEDQLAAIAATVVHFAKEYQIEGFIADDDQNDADDRNTQLIYQGLTKLTEKELKEVKKLLCSAHKRKLNWGNILQDVLKCLTIIGIIVVLDDYYFRDENDAPRYSRLNTNVTNSINDIEDRATENLVLTPGRIARSS